MRRYVDLVIRHAALLVTKFLEMDNRSTATSITITIKVNLKLVWN